MRLTCWIFAFALAARVHAGVSVTADQLTLTLDEKSGTVAAVKVSGKLLSIVPGRPLIAVREVRPGAVFNSFNGIVQCRANDCVLKGEAAGAGLSGEVRLRNVDGMIAADSTFTSSKKEGRGFAIKIALPLAERDVRWSGSLLEEITPKSGTLYGANNFPIAALTDARQEWGLAAAIPPTEPVSYDTHLQDGEFGLYYYAGTSPLTRDHPNEVRLSARLYAVDPRWGFRSALDRYYRAFPEFYRVRAKSAGAWCFHMNPEENELASNTCTYYEAGGAELQLVKGTENLRGPSYETNGYWTSHVSDPQEWARKNSIPAAASHGMQVFPYTIVGQRQIYMLPEPELIQDYERQKEALEKWTIDPPVLFENPVLANGFRTVGELKDIIRNSCLYTPEGRMVIEPRFYTGNTLTFPLNPSPSLYNDTTQETIARYTLDYYVPYLLKALPELKGIYVDSMGRWCNFLNYRKDHFRYAKYPLDVDASGTPVIRSLAPHYEYLKTLGDRLHPSGRLVFANGVSEGVVKPRHGDARDSDAARPISRFFLAAVSDIAGAESGIGTTMSHMAANRVMMGPKPYVILAKPPAGADKIEPYLKRGLVMGVFASLGDLYYSRPELRHFVEELRSRYLPALRLLHAAEWEPVRGVTGLDGAAGERFGDPSRGACYLTLYNDTAGPKQLSIQLDRGIFGGHYRSVIDRFDEPGHAFPISKGVTSVPLAAGQVRVLEFHN